MTPRLAFERRRIGYILHLAMAPPFWPGGIERRPSQTRPRFDRRKGQKYVEIGSRLDEQSTQQKNMNLGDRDQSLVLAILQFSQHHSPPRPSCIVARRREKRRPNNPTKCIPKTIGGLGAQSGENLLYNPAPGPPVRRPMVLGFGVGRGCTCTPVERRRRKEEAFSPKMHFPLLLPPDPHSLRGCEGFLMRGGRRCCSFPRFPPPPPPPSVCTGRGSAKHCMELGWRDPFAEGEKEGGS